MTLIDPGIPEHLLWIRPRSPVVDRNNLKKVVGMLKRTDVIVAYNNAVLRRSLEVR